jgi:hypothetical protein
MKNSINKAQVQSFAVSTIKAVVCVPHLLLQSSANILMIGEAKAINLVDGTEMIVSINHRSSYTQEKMEKVANFVLEQEAKVKAKLESRRQQDIYKAKKHLDQLEGVEHQEEETFIPINKRTKSVPTMNAKPALA